MPIGLEQWRAQIGALEAQRYRYLSRAARKAARGGQPARCGVSGRRMRCWVGIVVCVTLLGLALSCSLLLLRAGDIETNPGPLPDYNEVDDTELTEEDIYDVNEGIATLAGRWKDMYFALQLRPLANTSIIAEANPNNAERCLRAVLLKWLQKGYDYQKLGPPNWRMLVRAVANSAGGSNCALADKIAKCHQAIPAEPSLEMDIPPAKQDQPCASGQHHPSSPMFTVIECKGCIETLERKLEKLVSSTHKIMKENGVNVSELCFTVANTPISVRDESTKLLKESIPEISRATSLFEVFLYLSRHCWNYLNFDLLQHLVGRYGDDKTKQMMQEYESEVKDFRKKTSVRVFWEANDHKPIIRPEDFPPNVKEYTVERDWSPDSKTLEDIEELREEIACELYLYKLAIYIYRILPHSIEITFLVPSFVLEDQEHAAAQTGETQEIRERLQKKVGQQELAPNSLSPEEELPVLSECGMLAAQIVLQAMSEFVWKKQGVTAEHGDYPEKTRRVLVVYTGGTIGMKWSKETASNYLESKIRTNPMFSDPTYTIPEEERMACLPFEPIALPHTLQRYHILYCIYEYEPLLDSSNMSMSDWVRIAKDIKKYYQQFNAFVILHGTDTMCYTASALSFMCENLGKTIILSGSQVPLSELRNDGRDNLLGALVIAGQYIIPEVTIYFHNKLYRGNRSTMVNSASYEPFETPNLLPLASVGVDISVEWDAIHHPSSVAKFRVHTEMNQNVGILRMFPGITAATVQSFLQPPMQGVVLQNFGAGNVPDTRTYLLQELRAACERGVIIVNCSQCASGHVTENYAAGRKLRELGILPGADMTTEAAFTKLSYLLGRDDLSLSQVKEHLVRNLQGEMTPMDTNQHQFSLRDSQFLQCISSDALKLSSNKEVKMVRQALFPPLMCAAAANGDIESLKLLFQQGGDFNLPDYNGRTPLHLACCEGHLETARYLLHKGASVHAQDRFNHTPLHDAVRFKRHDVIQLLVQMGAHLTGSACEAKANLYEAACEKDAEALLAWKMAGADLSTLSNSSYMFENSLKGVATTEEKLVHAEDIADHISSSTNQSNTTTLSLPNEA